MSDLKLLPDLPENTQPSFEPAFKNASLDALPDLETTVQKTYNRVRQTSPDEAAKILTIAKKTGEPYSFVAANLPDAEVATNTPTTKFWHDLDKQYPGTSKWLQLPENMAVAHDDMPSLQKVEDTVGDASFGESLFRAAQSGLSSMNASLFRIPAYLYNAAAMPQNAIVKLLGRPDLQVQAPKWAVDNPVSKYYDQGAEAFRTPEMDESTTALIRAGDYKRAARVALTGIVANLPQQVPLLIMAATGYGSAGLVGAGLQQAAASTKENQGKDPLAATMDATLQGTFEAAWERVGTLGIFKKIEADMAKTIGKESAAKLVKEMAKDVFVHTAGEGGEEFGTQLSQDFSKVITGMDPNAMRGTLQRSLDAAIIGYGSGITMTAPAATLSGYSKALQLKRAEQTKRVYKAIGENVKGMKVGQRLPEARQQFVDAVTKDGPITDIWIKPAALEKYFGAKGIDIAEVKKFFGISDALWQEAVETGDLKIPIANWTSIVDTEHYNALENDIRFHQEDPSRNEVKEMQADTDRLMQDAVSKAEQMAKQVEQEAANNPQVKADYDNAYNIVKGGLEAAGMETAQAEQNAKVWAARTITESRRRGVTVDSLLAAKPQVQGTEQTSTAPEALTQSGPNELMSLDVLGKKVTVYKNPTGSDMDAMRKEHAEWFRGENGIFPRGPALEDSIRTIGDDQGNFYTWPAFKAQHDDVANALKRQGVNADPKTGSYLMQEALSKDPKLAPAFAAWFGDSKVVDEKGQPMVVYHGSTHVFNTFDLKNANVENYYGKAFYFTDSTTDVGSNYAGEGPDLTNRIERRAEEILQELYSANGPKATKKGLKYGTPAYKKAMDKAKSQARKELSGGSPAVYPTYLKMENPVVLTGKNQTVFEINYDEETEEETGNGVDLYNAVMDTSLSYGLEGQKVWGSIMENLGDPSYFTASEFDDAARKSEDIMNAYMDADGGALASNDLIKEIYKAAGFDGIIMDADTAFGNKRQMGQKMDMDSGTKHYIVFEPTQIKSAIGNRGTFDPNNPNILMQPAYHGSPYNFDKFTLDHIGKGEGAQAYGWGLYFAGNKEVAEFYKNKLGSMEVIVDGVNVGELDYSYDPKDYEGIVRRLKLKTKDEKYFAPSLIQAYFKYGANWGEVRKDLESNPYKDKEKTLKVLGQIEKRVVGKSSGKLYEVNIPEDDVLLDWDKPVQEQSNIMKILRSPKGQDLMKKMGLGFDVMEKTGEELYIELKAGAGQLSSPPYTSGQFAKEASEALNSLGIKGIKYLDGNSRGKGEGNFNYVIFDDSAIEILNKFYQGGDKKARGFYDQAQNIIGLLKNKDASTFMHESAHFWLKSQFDFVKSGQADETYLKDWKVMADWLGVKDDQKALTKDQQEKFARGWEAYLMEGKAPSETLKDAFNSFRDWLVSIYKTIRNLNVEVTPEVRGVFDRMLASESEIATARAEIGADQALELADVPENMVKDIERLRKKANDEAMTTLTKSLMKELEEKYVREKESFRNKLEKDEAQRLRKEPAYASMEVLRSSNKFIGKDPKEISKLYLEGGLTEVGMANYDSIAIGLGFNDGHELARLITKAAPFTEVLNDRVEMGMAAKYADLVDLPDFKEQALAAVHNEYQIELMALEREALRAEIFRKSDRTYINEAVSNLNKLKADAAQKPLKDFNARIIEEARLMKQKAKDILGSKPYREANQYRIYITAEKNAAIGLGRALANKDYPAAIVAKTQQMLNHALAMESLKIREAGENIAEFLSTAGDRTEKLPASGKLPISADANEQINRLLMRYGFADLIPMPEQTKSLAEYVADLQSHGDDVVVADWLLNGTVPASNWKDLSIEQLRDLKDAVKSIKQAGKREKTLSTGELIDEVTQDFVNNISANLKENPIPYDPAASNVFTDTAAKFVNAHRSLTYIMRALDGYNFGKITKFVMGRLRKARAMESTMGTEANQKLEAIWDKHYPAQGGNPFNKWKARSEMATRRFFFNQPLIDAVFAKGVTKENLIMMALNQGTELNKQRLLESYAYQARNPITGEMEWTYRLGQEHIDMMLAKLDKNDWQFVQDTLDLVNSYWPKIAELERERTGIEPRKRQAISIQTPHGDFAGGYFHIEYDPRYSNKADQQSLEDSMKGLIEGSHITPSTRRGHTKETVTHVWGRPLMLQFSVIDRHVQSVIHDLSFIETIRDLDRVFTNEQVSNAIKARMGDGAYKQIRPALAYIGYENRPQVNPVERILSGVRARASAFYLMFRMTSVLSQTAGVGVAMGAVGAKNYAAHLSTWSPEKWNFVMEKSRIMRERVGNRDRDVKDAMKSMMEKGKLNNITKFGFFMQGYMDVAIAMPEWMAAYDNELHRQQMAKEPMNQDAAITVADETVQSTQGSGDAIDLSAMQRGSEFMKLLTMFYTPFNPIANKQIEIWERLRQNGVSDLPAAMSFMIYWMILPGIVAGLMSGDIPDGDDDDESWYAWTVRQSLAQFFGGWIGIRDAANFAVKGGRLGYRLSPVEGTIEKVLKPIVDVVKLAKGDDVEPSTLVKDTAESAMLIAKMPGRQISITAGYIMDLLTGEADTFEPQRLVYPERRN